MGTFRMLAEPVLLSSTNIYYYLFCEADLKLTLKASLQNAGIWLIVGHDILEF
jgi:hypothetical protein